MTMLIFHRKVEKTITNDGQTVQKKFEKKNKNFNKVIVK